MEEALDYLGEKRVVSRSVFTHRLVPRPASRGLADYGESDVTPTLATGAAPAAQPTSPAVPDDIDGGSNRSTSFRGIPYALAGDADQLLHSFQRPLGPQPVAVTVRGIP